MVANPGFDKYVTRTSSAVKVVDRAITNNMLFMMVHMAFFPLFQSQLHTG